MTRRARPCRRAPGRPGAGMAVPRHPFMRFFGSFDPGSAPVDPSRSESIRSSVEARRRARLAPPREPGRPRPDRLGPRSSGSGPPGRTRIQPAAAVRIGRPGPARRDWRRTPPPRTRSSRRSNRDACRARPRAASAPPGAPPGPRGGGRRRTPPPHRPGEPPLRRELKLLHPSEPGAAARPCRPQAEVPAPLPSSSANIEATNDDLAIAHVPARF